MQLAAWSGHLEVGHHVRRTNSGQNRDRKIERFQNCAFMTQAAVTCLRTVTNCELLWVRRWTCWSHQWRTVTIISILNISSTIICDLDCTKLQSTVILCHVCFFVNRRSCFGVIVCLLRQEIRGTLLIMLYFCLPVMFPFLCYGNSSKYFIHSADRYLGIRKCSALDLRTNNTLVALNGATYLHIQSTHSHLFNWWFYWTAFCLLGSQWANCGASVIKSRNSVAADRTCQPCEVVWSRVVSQLQNIYIQRTVFGAQAETAAILFDDDSTIPAS